MTTTIRTPDDEVTTAGYFYPPFKEGLTYQGATYAGHSDYSVDFNRRSPSGAWMPDRGDPVLACARGTVVHVDEADGFVIIRHGRYRTEYGHMDPVEARVGQKVSRGDRIGRIGDRGNAPNGTHLHHAQYKLVGGAWQRIQASFEGVPLSVSVQSDDKPPSWDPPEPILVKGPPRRATWERAYRQAAAALAKCEAAQTPPPEDPA